MARTRYLAQAFTLVLAAALFLIGSAVAAESASPTRSSDQSFPFDQSELDRLTAAVLEEPDEAKAAILTERAIRYVATAQPYDVDLHAELLSIKAGLLLKSLDSAKFDYTEKKSFGKVDREYRRTANDFYDTCFPQKAKASICSTSPYEFAQSFDFIEDVDQAIRFYELVINTDGDGYRGLSGKALGALYRDKADFRRATDAFLVAARDFDDDFKLSGKSDDRDLYAFALLDAFDTAHRGGYFQEAVEYAEKSLVLKNDDSTQQGILDSLADSYQGLGFSALAAGTRRISTGTYVFGKGNSEIENIGKGIYVPDDSGLPQSIDPNSEPELYALFAKAGGVRIAEEVYSDGFRHVGLLVSLARFERYAGHYAEAERLLTAAEAERRGFNVLDHYYGAYVRAERCGLSLAQKRLDEAVRHCRQAVEFTIDDRLRSIDFVRYSREDETMRQMVKPIHALLADIEWARRMGELDGTAARDGLDLAYASLQATLFSNVGSAATMRFARDQAEGRLAGLGSLSKQMEDLNAKWRASSARLQMLVARTDTATGVEAVELDASTRAIGQQISQLSSEIDAKFPAYSQLHRFLPLSVQETQKLLKPDELVLLVVPEATGSHVIGITSEEVTWRKEAISESEVTVLARRLLWDVGANVTPSAEEAAQWQAESAVGYPFARKSAFELYQRLLEPTLKGITGRRQILASFGGALTSLPIGMLVIKQPVGDDGDPQTLRETDWLADDYSVTIVPALQSLRYRKKSDTGDSNLKPFVGFGDPKLTGPPPDPSPGPRRGQTNSAFASFAQKASRGPIDSLLGFDPEEVRKLDPLPGTAEELEKLRVAFGASPDALFVQDRANETLFRANAQGRIAVLAMATHGLMTGELAGTTEPSLVLTPPSAKSTSANFYDDGLLTASEISDLDLRADWIILSACNTASGDGSSGAAGLSGLARSFLFAGASNLLVSHWPVRDDVAGLLTVRTVEISRADPSLSRAEALARAIKEVRLDRKGDSLDDTWAHPNVWAPFSLVGFE